MVKALLGQEEANPKTPDDFGQTPRAYAAGAGHVKVVKMLLGWKEVNPDRTNKDGGTPLSYAGENDMK